MRDSFNTLIESVSMTRRNRLVVYDASGNRLGTSIYTGRPDRGQQRYPYLELSGRGCMSTYADEDNNALIAVRTPTPLLGPPLQRVDVRGSIDRRAFRGLRFIQGPDQGAVGIHVAPVDQVIDQIYTRCDQPFARKGATNNQLSVTRPFFQQGVEQYLGNPSTGLGGIDYTNFEKLVAPNPANVNNVILTDSTSGVARGGITRAVVASNGSGTLRDQIGYRDSNVPCWDGSATNKGAYIAQSDFVQLTSARPISVWYPTRSPNSSPQSRRYQGPPGAGTDLSCPAQAPAPPAVAP